MADNLQKQPSKGILKSSSSFDKQDVRLSTASTAPRRSIKETSWDEMNIIATLHPPDKDYGHMKIDEPKTPFRYSQLGNMDSVDAELLAERMRLGEETLPKVMQTDSSDEESDNDLTPEERAKRTEFASRRKKHYNEFYAVQLARKLLEEDGEEDTDDQKTCKSKPCPPQGCLK